MKNKVLLLIFLSITSLSSFAKVGDVYYCNKTQSVILGQKFSTNMTDYSLKILPDKFKFRRDKKEIVSDGFTIDKIPYSSFWDSESSESFWSTKNLLYGFNYNYGNMKIVYFNYGKELPSALYKCSIF